MRRREIAREAAALIDELARLDPGAAHTELERLRAAVDRVGRVPSREDLDHYRAGAIALLERDPWRAERCGCPIRPRGLFGPTECSKAPTIALVRKSWRPGEVWIDFVCSIHARKFEPEAVAVVRLAPQRLASARHRAEDRREAAARREAAEERAAGDIGRWVYSVANWGAPPDELAAMRARRAAL